MPNNNTRPGTESSTQTHTTDKAEAHNDATSASSAQPPPHQSTTSSLRTAAHRLFAIPPPLKSLFDSCPLHIYSSNALPLRSPSHAHHQTDPDQPQPHTLYIFTTPSDVSTGAPSYNPSCLKWQTLLKIHCVPFVIRESNNHAAPGGALPFLIPAEGFSSPKHAQKGTSLRAAGNVVATGKLQAWLDKHYPLFPTPHQHRSAQQQQQQHRNKGLNQIYTSLLTPLRHAYLHALYLHPPIFASLATPLYIAPSSRSTLIRIALSAPLRAAALDQLILGAPGMGGSGLGVRVDVDALYAGAEEALEALSVILGDREWLSSHERDQSGGEHEAVPGEMDAAVFAYTHVILGYFGEQREETPAGRLVGMVRRWGNLVAHRERVMKGYYE